MIMNFNDRNRQCHPERSEGSGSMGRETLRCAQDDIPLPVLMVKIRHHAPTIGKATRRKA